MCFSSCYKESTDVCPTDELPRYTNIIYQAHWPANVKVVTNFPDTVSIYQVDTLDHLLTELDSGQSTEIYFEKYTKYIVYADVPDSLQAHLDSLVKVTVIYNCPD